MVLRYRSARVPRYRGAYVRTVLAKALSNMLYSERYGFIHIGKADTAADIFQFSLVCD
jgi:hypothetical protein